MYPHLEWLACLYLWVRAKETHEAFAGSQFSSTTAERVAQTIPPTRGDQVESSAHPSESVTPL